MLNFIPRDERQATVLMMRERNRFAIDPIDDPTDWLNRVVAKTREFENA